MLYYSGNGLIAAAERIKTRKKTEANRIGLQGGLRRGALRPALAARMPVFTEDVGTSRPQMRQSTAEGYDHI